MLDSKRVSYYDDSKKNELVILEIHVSFKDVIALRICNQPFYKLITYTDQISTLEHLKAKLSLEDFTHHPDKLTAESLSHDLEFMYNHNILPKGNFTKIIKRN